MRRSPGTIQDVVLQNVLIDKNRHGLRVPDRRYTAHRKPGHRFDRIGIGPAYGCPHDPLQFPGIHPVGTRCHHQYGLFARKKDKAFADLADRYPQGPRRFL